MDGEPLATVYTEGDFAYLPRAEPSITLCFTDDTLLVKDTDTGKAIAERIFYLKELLQR